MDLQHAFTVPASIDETWAAFQDIESVAGCFPGASVTKVDGDDFTGSAKVKLGPIALTYNGSGHFVEKDEAARRFVVEARGKDKRGNGTAGATVTATMSDEGGGSTRVEVLTDLSITGKPAQFGRGVIQDVSDKLLQQFVDCLQTKVGSSPEPASAEASTSAGAAEASTSEASTPEAETQRGPDPQPEPHPGAETADRSSSGEERVPVAETEEQAGAPAGRTTMSATTTGSFPGAATRSGDDALDLGATVLPAIARAYWKQALGVVVVLLVLRALARAMRR